MSENTYLSGKTSTRDAIRRFRFNPMVCKFFNASPDCALENVVQWLILWKEPQGIFTHQNAKCFSRAAGLNGAYSHSLRQHSENVIHAVSSGWFLPDSHLSPGSCLEDTSPSDSQDYPNTQIFNLDPCFLRHASPDARDTGTGRALPRKLEWRESGSASGLIKSASIASTSTDATVVPRYMHHIDPNMRQVSASSSTSSRHIHLKSTRRRKRIVHLRPKFPKYEGLSGFAAPMNLLPSSPPLSAVSDGVSLNKSAKSAPSPSKPNPMPTNHIHLSSSEKDDPKDKASPAEKQPNLVTGTPVDFLKNLTDEAWVNRQQTLEKMAIERKKLLLKTGFSDASGKPFPPDEPSIEAKPIPNRWVWYMRLSMDYDRMHGTVVPSGGPAAYLKYGWERMGKCGKQLYQELADAYSAQKVKHLAAHTLNRSSGCNPEKDVPKHLDHSSEQAANSPLPPGCNKHDDVKILGCGLTSTTSDFMAENACNENADSASTTGLGDKFAYTDVFSHETCLSSYSSSGMARSETNASQESAQSISNIPLKSSMSDGFLNLSTITDPFLWNGFDFSGFSPDFKNFLTQQGLEDSTQQPILDQHVLEFSMNWPSTGLSSELALVGQSAGNYVGFDFSPSLGTNVPESYPAYLHVPVSGQNNSNDLLMVKTHNRGCRMPLGENTGRPAVSTNEAVGFSSWVTPTFVKEQCDLLGSNIDNLFDF